MEKDWVIGDIEVYVNRNNLIRVKQILQKL